MRKLLGGLAVFTTPVAAMAMLTSSQNMNVQQLQGAAAKGLLAYGEKAQVEELAKQCGIECGSFVDGQASVTGIGSIDAFFGAVLSLEGQTLALEADLRATLGQMAAIVGVEVEAGASLDATAEAVVDGFAEFKGQIDGNITAKFNPPQCSVNVNATLDAKAKCEGEVSPGKVDVACKGECVADVSAEPPACEGEVKCTGTAPSFKCEGECTGACELKAGGECSGSCEGSCNFETAGKCDGECKGSTDEGGNCTGECEVRAGGSCGGTCTGRCNLEAAGSCSGECRGECTFNPGNAECSGRVSCTPPSANATVMCNGECRGEVEPPKVKAECEASVKAEAEMSAECTPPSIKLDYDLKADFEFNGSANAGAKAAFAAKVQAYGEAYAKLLAQAKKIELILRSTGNLTAAAGGAISSAADAIADAEFDVMFKLGFCLPDAVGEAKTKLTGSKNKLEASASAIAKVSGSIGG